MNLGRWILAAMLIAGSSVAGGCIVDPLAAGGDAIEPAARDDRCVDEGRYEARRDVVRDTRTSLVWQRRAPAKLAHADADRYCEGLQLGGLSGWRLPTRRELASLRYKAGGLFGGGSGAHYCIPSIDQASFPDTPAEPFWTADVADDDTAWYVGFDDGRTHRDALSSELQVRCVHDPPGSWPPRSAH